MDNDPIYILCYYKVHSDKLILNFVDQLSNGVRENWYSTNIDENHSICFQNKIQYFFHVFLIISFQTLLRIIRNSNCINVWSFGLSYLQNLAEIFVFFLFISFRWMFVFCVSFHFGLNGTTACFRDTHFCLPIYNLFTGGVFFPHNADFVRIKVIWQGFFLKLGE